METALSGRSEWHASCLAIYTGIEGSEWEDLYEHYRDRSKAAGVRKPSKKKRPFGR